MKKTNTLGSHFWLSGMTAVLAIVALAAYIVGAVGFAYYDDLNMLIVLIGAIGAAAALGSGVLQRKLGEKLPLSLLGLAAGAAMAICTMLIADARVYSIAVLLFSELEKDNVEGYRALYCSLAAMGLFLVAAGCNVASNFCAPRVKE